MTRQFAGFSISLLMHLALLLPLGINFLPNPLQVENYSSSLEITLVSSRGTNEETEKIIERIVPLEEEDDSSMKKPSKTIENVEKEVAGKEPVPVKSNPVAGAITDMAPTLKHNPAPIYPEEARTLNIEGHVELRAQVLITGRVGKIEVLQSSGYDVLDRAARDAIRKWLFTPARKGMEPVESSVVVPVNFQLLANDQTLITHQDSNQQ